MVHVPVEDEHALGARLLCRTGRDGSVVKEAAHEDNQVLGSFMSIGSGVQGMRGAPGVLSGDG